MANRFQSFLQNIFGIPEQPEEKAAEAASNGSTGGTIAPVEQAIRVEKTDLYHLQKLERKIMAKCASCGTVHPLQAVCHNCGKPLCGDQHCRKYRDHPYLGRKVVICQACDEKL